MYNLFLDDARTISEVTWVKYPSADWVMVRSYDEFVEYINKHGLPLRVSFDHDLADVHYSIDWEKHKRDGGYMQKNNPFNEKTGYDCAKFLISYCLDKDLELPEYHVHSLNPVGKDAIKQILNRFQELKNKN